MNIKFRHVVACAIGWYTVDLIALLTGNTPEPKLVDVLTFSIGLYICGKIFPEE
jgi:hypothetical protein